MATKIIFFVTLLAYGVIASQSFMYVLALKNVQLNLEPSAYTSFRKLIDTAMRANFTYVVYAALLASVLLVIAHIKNPGSLTFIMAAIALVALIADILLTLKGNLPINDVINTWQPNDMPANWESIRDKWFTVFQYRQIANITGFVALLVAAVFGKR